MRREGPGAAAVDGGRDEKLGTQPDQNHHHQRLRPLDPAGEAGGSEPRAHRVSARVKLRRWIKEIRAATVRERSATICHIPRATAGLGQVIFSNPRRTGERERAVRSGLPPARALTVAARILLTPNNFRTSRDYAIVCG